MAGQFRHATLKDTSLDLLEAAAAALSTSGVDPEAVIVAVSRQLMEAPGATPESVAAVVSTLPTAAEVSREQIDSLVAVENDRKEALSRECLDPEKVAFGESYYCPNGSVRVGAQVVKVCSVDGETGCLTTSDYKAAAVAGLATKVVLGQKVAGEEGAVRLPDQSSVEIEQTFGPFDALRGTYVPDFPEPANVRSIDTTNGVTGTYTPDFPDVANVRSTDTVNGVAGSLATCTVDGDEGCVVPLSTAFKAADTSGLALKLVATQSVAGVTGSVVLPAATSVLSGTSYGASSATSGRVVLPPAGAVLIGTNFGPDSLTSGAYSPDFPDASNVRSIDTTNGVTGTYTPDFPDVANVRSTDTVNGVAGSLATCSVDGDEGCVVPLSTAFKAADTTAFTDWDIRRKRASDGSVITFAGIPGRNKVCRNRANLTMGPDTDNTNDSALPYNNTTAPASSDSLVPDFFDTLEDYNNNLTGLPPDIVPWTIPGVAGTHGGDFTCGGIYSTGNTTSGNTGADSSLAHDPNGNWQDLTPGIVPGGANSTNTAPGCNATDKLCVFRELISGLMVTERASSTRTWQSAIDYCHSLGEPGGVITSPIPTLNVGLGTSHTDWRLPTQKEMLHLYNAGIRGLNQTTGLVSRFGDLDTSYWTATSSSFSTAQARFTNPYEGYDYINLKTVSFRVLCVR